MVTSGAHDAPYEPPEHTVAGQGVDPLRGERRIRRELRLLRVRQGDRLVVQLPDDAPIESAQRIEAMFAAEGIRSVVVGGGLRVVAMQGDDDTYTDVDGTVRYQL